MSVITMIRRYRIQLLVLLVMAVPAVALIAYFAGSDAAKLPQASAKVSRGNIENLVTAIGNLQPRDYVDVGAQVSGQLKILHVDVGSEVKKGDLLAEIDATVYLAKVDATRAQLRNQQALLKDRQSQLRLAQINHNRQKNLLAEEATTQESLESAEASLQSATAQIASLQAQIEQTSSGLREEEANLEFARIYAPMDGTVVSISARQGQTLNANQAAPTILRLADLSVMTVQAQVSEADVSKLSKDMPVYFTTLGGEGYRWYSKLSKIEPTPVVNNNVVLYNALFDVPNTNGLLMTQMTAQVFFIVAQANDVLQVPVAALRYLPLPERSQSIRAQRQDAENNQSQDSAQPRRPAAERQQARAEGARPQRMQQAAVRERPATVQVLNSKGMAETREVVVGVSSCIQAQIISGLAEGETVLTGQSSSAAQTNNTNRMPPGMGGPRVVR